MILSACLFSLPLVIVHHIRVRLHIKHHIYIDNLFVVVPRERERDTGERERERESEKDEDKKERVRDRKYPRMIFNFQIDENYIHRTTKRIK
jgi:hypothetical protein